MEISNDRIQASAIPYLLDGGQTEAAGLLLACAMELAKHDFAQADSGEELSLMRAELRTSMREAVTILNDKNHPITSAIQEALNTSLPPMGVVDWIWAR